MEKTILITTEFCRIDKRRWPKYVKDFLDNPDINAIHPEHGSKIAFHRFNTDAYPRLVFIEEKDELDNIVYVVRKFFEKHDDYDIFRDLSEKEKLQKCKYTPAEKEELENKFADFKAPITVLPTLPLEMRDYEKQRDFSNTATSYVFEMEEWCSHLKNKEFEDDKRIIFETIQNIIIDKKETDADENNWHSVKFGSNKEIVFRVHELNSHTYYYLFDIAIQKDISTLQNKYIDLTDKTLLKQAKKGFPDWILYGEFDDWKQLENDDKANLALSDEEVDVLNKTPYPYFINGLAGSGKSTILYYLFAHAYSYKNHVEKPMDFLFLSYSRELIVKAKSTIKALLKTNPSYLGFELTKEEEKNFEQCFSPFQDFLINCYLDTEEEINRFSSEKQLSYEKFKKEYKLSCKLNEAKNYSAEMVWSVIRTFIKGRNYKSSFTPKSYNSLRSNERTVSSVDFENIYKIWKNWYAPTYEGKYWDDLDLVTYILRKQDSEFKYKKYDIIYCDEAQDFTPIENELILRLSKYTSFDLKGFSKIPIAYAGDPNQTVSPTGFNWKRLKEIVDKTYSSLIGDHVRVKEKTLNNNYRSKKTIVEFANSIQYIRKLFLTDDALTPQEQWNPQSNPLPGFFFLTTDGTRDDDSLIIKAGFEVNECIITGADGEYERELDKDELTADSTTIDDVLLASIDNKTKLYTAISAKGLEFNAVLLYRFADQLPKSFSKILNNEEIGNESDKYELSHFFTKLYIAISRAREVLYIADTQENYNKFWKYFIDNTFVKKLLKGKQEEHLWKSKIGGIELGRRAEYLERLKNNFDPLKTANESYKQALLSQKSQQMNRAAGYFEEGGDYYMANVCKAYVMLYEKNYSNSGHKFLEIGKRDEANNAFWDGCCWIELTQNDDNAFYHHTALYMTGRISLMDYIKNKFIIVFFKINDETCKKVVIHIMNDAKSLETTDIILVLDFLKQLSKRGFRGLMPTIAELYFKNKQYKQAITIWEELDIESQHNNYCKQGSFYFAKVETCTTTAEKVYWLSMCGKNDEILKHYSTPKDAEIYGLDERAKKIVFFALLQSKSYEQAFNYPIDDEIKLQALYRADRIMFMEKHVLSDFNEDKFFTWIEQPIKNGSDLFEHEMPSSLFEKIFTMPLMKNWVLFMNLKGADGISLMKNDINVNRVTDAICKVLSKKYYTSLASCFIDVVFNNDSYNFANANKYVSTLLDIFAENDINTRDFIAASKRNVYFDTIGLTGQELDLIKERLRDFVQKKIRSYKNIKDSDCRTIFILCKIYEKAAHQYPNSRGKFIYEHKDVLSFYSSLMKSHSTSRQLETFIGIRKAIISARFDGKQRKADFVNALPECVDARTVVDTCDKEDAIWLIPFFLGNGKGCLDDDLNWITTFIVTTYDFEIKLRDFEKKKIQSNLKQFFIGYVDDFLYTLLNEGAEKGNIDEFVIKITAYVYEVFLEDDAEKASKYDSLASSPRLQTRHKLVKYLQQRALHFYSYGNEGNYKMKTIDYDLNTPISIAREKIYPLIERTKQESIPSYESTKEKPSSELTTISTPQKGKNKKHNNCKKKVYNKESENGKKAVLEMARNLKNAGVPIEVILQSSPALTLQEILDL